jgi:hypothetical protein
VIPQPALDPPDVHGMPTAGRPPETLEERERRGQQHRFVEVIRGLECGTWGTSKACASPVTSIRPIARSIGTGYGFTRL